jgi:hypothetical protein
MAGYSGTPLLKKLGIKDGQRVLLRNAPAALPRDLRSYASGQPNKDLDVVLLFAYSRAAFQAEFARLATEIKSDGTIWIAWPKRSSGVATDLTENIIREDALKTAFVDVKVCAIDDTWSGLKLVIRKERRPAHAAAIEI